jgi:sulfite reductase beta subunit-like hemoprotein
LLDLIKQAAQDVARSGNPVEVFEAVVITAPPNLSIRLKGNSGLVIPKELIVVAELLTKHKRKVKLSSTNITDEETLQGMGPHQHDLTSIILDNSELEFLNELAVGERVMVIRFSGGQKYWICDRIVQY